MAKRRGNILNLPAKFNFTRFTLTLTGLMVIGLAVAFIFAGAANFSSTAYTPGSVDYSPDRDAAHPCGPFNDDGRTLYTHHTANGACPQEGVTIAVDPRVIPLGTTVCIKELGTRVAQDTGGAIQGAIVDVFMNSSSAAKRWGRRAIYVTWPGPCGTNFAALETVGTIAGNPYPCDHRSLIIGSSGPCVQNLQWELNHSHHNYQLSETGRFNFATFAAVFNYQVRHGLPATGIVGPLVWGALHDSR